MSESQPKPGLLVEDSSVSAGTDAQTGAPVIRPKSPVTGKVDESINPTDQREKSNPRK
jgi:hypothetical protein